MNKGWAVGIVLLLACDKINADRSGSAASASASATAAASTTAQGMGGSAPAAASGPAAGAGVAGGKTLVGGDHKGIATIDGGASIYNGDKKVEFDGGALNLQNQGKQAGITTGDGGTTLKGASGKTLNIPPIPGR